MPSRREFPARKNPAPTRGAPAGGLALELRGIGLARAGPSGGPRAILDGVELHIAAGEHMAIVGPSGAGKSSLLHVAAGALRPDHGQLLLDGAAFWSASASARQRMRRTLFLAPQLPPLPARQRVVTATLAARLPTMGLLRGLLSLVYPLDLPAAREALAAFGLEQRIFDRVDRLSGGERQRVGLARALVSPARLWLLDEPLAALDPMHAGRILEVLCDAAARRGVTLVVSLHHADLARAHFPRIVGIRAGRLAFDAAAADLTPRHWSELYAGDASKAGGDDASGDAFNAEGGLALHRASNAEGGLALDHASNADGGHAWGAASNADGGQVSGMP